MPPAQDDGIESLRLEGAIESRGLSKKIVLALLAVLVLWVGFEWITFPDVAKLATEAPKTTAFMERRREELRSAGKDDALQYRWVPYGAISPNLRRAVLVAEDDTFYQHHGIDVKGIEEALEKDWKKRKFSHGGSTITQQLAKNLYLSPSRNPLRKIKEYFIAKALERYLSKKRIIELYLNVSEFGERIYGAEAAARFYFHVSAASLTPPQAALLAGCLPNPRVMNPAQPNKRLRWRQRMVLSRMHRLGYVYEKELLTEKKPEPEAASAPASPQATDSDLAPPAPKEKTETDAGEESDTTATSSETPPTQTST